MSIFQEDVSNYHVQYQDLTSQHWNPGSEQFAGADNLTTALSVGWTIDPDVVVRHHWYAGSRCVRIYDFSLRRDQEAMIMPVLENPYVNRMIKKRELNLIQSETI